MTPAEELRKAAERIREVAGKATPGPWRAEPCVYGAPGDGYGEPDVAEVFSDEHAEVVSHQWHEGGGASIPDAEHISLWDPTAAVLVADVFDRWARMGELDPDLLHRVGGPETLALARAILGGQS